MFHEQYTNAVSTVGVMHMRIFVNVCHICCGYCGADRYHVFMTSFVPSVPQRGWCEKNTSEFCRVLFPGHVLPVRFTGTCTDTHYRIQPYIVHGTFGLHMLRKMFSGLKNINQIWPLCLALVAKEY